MACYEADAAGITLAVRLTPRGGRDGIDGVIALSDGREVVAARVRAVADKGAANDALVALLAAAFAVPKRSVALTSGATSRLKRVRIEGDPAALSAVVKGWAG